MLIHRSNATVGNRRKSRGFTLIEFMIAIAISLVVSLAMLTLMANTLGTGAATARSTRWKSVTTARTTVTRPMPTAARPWTMATATSLR